MSISVTISPTAPKIAPPPYPCHASTPPAQQILGAAVTGDVANAGVTFSVSQGAGSILQTGPFSAVYYPPPPPPGQAVGATAKVTAASVTLPSATATATVTY
jgi:hypothetical protein